MKINEIRQTFLNYFESKGHDIVPSAPMVIKNDPTLMFTNAGMNQFKDYFLGYHEPKNKRVANSQKCLRVSGKQNDLEEVGVDTYHHTMFEMLGNWSFGDYFKEEAIDWAWDLLINHYKLDKDRLYMTVFEGDAKDNVEEDKESIQLWSKYISKDRILKCSGKDNFWEMGDTGPCGPCSEIHIDIRSDEERAKIDGKSLVNEDHPLVIEIWNLVFMQYNRMADGKLKPLPNKHVDTGMGLERLAMVMQAQKSNYDTDLFQTLLTELKKLTPVKYGASEKSDIAFRVIVDHIRAIAFSICDGQLPSNTGAGYVIRRILRRAVRYGYSFLEFDEPFMNKLTTTLVTLMGDSFPELLKQENLIEKVILEEETSFFRTLENGIKRINTLIETVKADGGKTIDGKAAFELYDTFGFPFDLTLLIARENEIEVDEIGFENELQHQKDRSRAATQITSDDWVIIKEDDVEEFVGYDLEETEIEIVKYRQVKQKNKEFYQLVFNITPFYAEGGGQVGDTGFIQNSTEKIGIFNTKRENNLIVHFAKELPKNPMAKFQAIVNAEKRRLTRSNHSATHLLHYVLREILGTHVEQKGSLVNSDHLRFDFSHFSKITPEEMELIEKQVNVRIREGIALEEKRAVPKKIAEGMGAMALFGEKYGDLVRVIKFGESVELCGGIHVENTSEIGRFKIMSEGSVASGVRRIEAITADAAEEYFNTVFNEYKAVSDLLKKQDNLSDAVSELMLKNNNQAKEIELLKKELAKGVKTELKGKIEDQGDLKVLRAQVNLGTAEIKDICFQLKSEFEKILIVLGGKDGDKASLTICITEEIAKSNDWHAGNLVREAAKHIKGGGGGQPFFATAGGTDASGIKNAIDEVIKKTIENG